MWALKTEDQHEFHVICVTTYKWLKCTELPFHLRDNSGCPVHLLWAGSGEHLMKQKLSQLPWIRDNFRYAFSLEIVIFKNFLIFFSKRLNSNYFGLAGPTPLWHTYPTLPLLYKCNTDHTLINGQSCVLIKFYLWTLKFDFLTIFTCHAIFFFWLFQSIYFPIFSTNSVCRPLV